MFTIKTYTISSGAEVRDTFEAEWYRVTKTKEDGKEKVYVRVRQPQGKAEFTLELSAQGYHKIIIENESGRTTDIFRWVIPAAEEQEPFATGF